MIFRSILIMKMVAKSKNVTVYVTVESQRGKRRVKSPKAGELNGS
jgi:hypothetical protein